MGRFQRWPVCRRLFVTTISIGSVNRVGKVSGEVSTVDGGCAVSFAVLIAFFFSWAGVSEEYSPASSSIIACPTGCDAPVTTHTNPYCAAKYKFIPRA